MNNAKTKLNVLGESVPADPKPTAPTGSRLEHAAPIAIGVDVVSDVICPWCYVGKRRLERAIDLLGPHARVAVTWRPFQLNPTMPKAGMDRNAYRSAKCGSLERSRALDAKLAAVGATEGIEFHLEHIRRTPNTLDAHRLVWLARQLGKGDAVVEAIFRAYFIDGVDVGDPGALLAIAVSAGMARTPVERMLATDDGMGEVLGEEARYKAMGIDGVPGFVVNGRFLFSGAAEPEAMAEAFVQAAS